MATGQKTTPETFGTMGRKAGDQAKNMGEKAGEQAKHMGEKVGEQAKSFGEKVGEQAKHMGEKVGEQAKHIGESITEGAHTAAQTAVQTVENAGTYMGHSAEQATGGLGRGLGNVASTIREHTPKEGMMHSAGEAVAETLESGGRYLEDHKLREIGDDLTNLIRRNPIPALLLGVGVGFILARAIRS